MSYLYRFVIVVLVLLAGYSLFGIGHFKWMHYSVNNPKAEFLVSGDASSNITVVEFLNYGCDYCKTLHPVIEELKEVRKDVRYVARPIRIGTAEEDKAGHIAVAAGLQGRFEEMHNAFLEYPDAEIPENFVKETAEFYGLDYDKLMADSQSDEVNKIMDSNSRAMEHAGMNTVPSFFIGNKVYAVTNTGLPDLKEFLNIISTSAN